MHAGGARFQDSWDFLYKKAFNRKITFHILLTLYSIERHLLIFGCGSIYVEKIVSSMTNCNYDDATLICVK